MGLFDMFGKSFDDQVNEAINDIGATTPGISGLHAEVHGKVITLKGKAESREAANLAMQKIDQAVKADNIVNAIEVEKATEPVIDGKASDYMKIFEANRDILDNPDLIKPGQNLKIPE